MAGDLQTQIDALRTRIVNLQYAISLRAKKSDVITYQGSISTSLDGLVDDIAEQELRIKEIEADLLDARDELRTHTH